MPPSPAALFPPHAKRQELDDFLTRALQAAALRVRAGPVMPRADMHDFRRQLQEIDFDAPRSLHEMIEWTIGHLERGIVQMSHPRYFGLFNPAPNFPAQCADRIAGAFNPQLASSGSSPVPVAIESHVIGALAARAGLGPAAGGHFTNSGSEANFTALHCALTRAHADYPESGVRVFCAPLAVYASRDCHPVWMKVAHQTGIGRQALRSIPTDGSGRMDCALLASAIAEDRRNNILPLMICATAGTTGGGMIDPLQACAAQAREQGIWFHVDAAWGGAALCSERLRGLLDGIEMADSITIDAHKWFATTMGCGMFLINEAGLLNEAFGVQAEFMPSNAIRSDPYLNSVQWSRRFIGLRLFLSLATAGWHGFAQHVERAVDLIGGIRSRLAALGWTIANQSGLAVLCVIPPAGSNGVHSVVRDVLASGRVWVAKTTFESREVVRICVTHGECSDADADELVRVLHSATGAQ
jgi:glutamate/tyrosine decarboxylase-like PLP-dependent enzyme